MGKVGDGCEKTPSRDINRNGITGVPFPARMTRADRRDAGRDAVMRIFSYLRYVTRRGSIKFFSRQSIIIALGTSFNPRPAIIGNLSVSSILLQIT